MILNVVLGKLGAFFLKRKVDLVLEIMKIFKSHWNSSNAHSYINENYFDLS